jgi:hypothetical protein
MYIFIPLLLALSRLSHALPAPAQPLPATPTKVTNQDMFMPFQPATVPSQITPRVLAPRQSIIPGGGRFTFTIPGGPTLTLGGTGHSVTIWEEMVATAAPVLGERNGAIEERERIEERQGWISSVLPVRTDPTWGGGGYTCTIPGGPTFTLGGTGALSFTIGAVATAVAQV